MKSTKSYCEQDYKERNLSESQKRKLETSKTQLKMMTKKIDGGRKILDILLSYHFR